MKEELEKELIDIAPYMFTYEGSQDIQKSLMCFGFACGNGWFNLLKELIIAIKEKDVEKKVKVFQVKEKFGGLRFYINSGTEEIFNLIRIAEEKSEKTCEYCGEPATKTTHGWITNLCDKCFNSLQKRMDIW